MRKQLLPWIGLLLALLLSSPALAQGAGPTQRSASTWQATYWNNQTLTGIPVLQRSEPILEHIWQTASPDPVVNADHFSARWTQVMDVPAGTYRFTATSDDGIRIWVDNQLLIDQWSDHSAQTFTADIYLNAGHHLIKVEYYENMGMAQAVVVWLPSTVQAATYNWRGEYYNNPDLNGVPVLVRDDKTIDFDWGNGSPAGGINSDNFSVRWTRSLSFAAGHYRFATETDDGVRLYIDGKLVIDQWRPMGPTPFSYDTFLEAGTHTIRMEYFERTGDAVARLSWRVILSGPQEGNLITCVPPQPQNYAWITIHRLDSDGSWVNMTPNGIGSIRSTGYLKVDGLFVDYDRYGDAGHPYWIQEWVDGKVVHSVGNTQQGEPEFRIRPNSDNYTPWQCPLP